MLYTRKGDTGTTKVLNTKAGQRISKSSCQTESLGALDELNSFLGLLKVHLTDTTWDMPGTLPAALPGKKVSGHGRVRPDEVIHWVQNCLFVLQAEAAGSDLSVKASDITAVEYMIDEIEKEMPPIKTFFISGGTELAALSDVSRTLARKAERRVIAAVEEGSIAMESASLQFLNRLSSLLYGLSRYVNFRSGAAEQAPWYN